MKPKFFLSISHFTMIFLCFSLLLLSCSNKKEELKLQAKAAVTKDIRSLTEKTIDGFTVGLGSMIMNMALTKKDQDSLILKPIMPFINKELDAKSEKELTEIAGNKNERLKLIGQTLFKNKDAIKSSLNDKFKFANDLIDMAIEYSNQMLQNKNAVILKLKILMVCNNIIKRD